MNKRNVSAFAVALVIGIMFVVQARASGGEKIYTSRKAVTDCETMIASEQATTENIKEQNCCLPSTKTINLTKRKM